MLNITDIAESRELSGIRTRWHTKCCDPTHCAVIPRNETLQSAVWPEQEMTVEQQICQQELVSQ